ncbi:hypothetical protein KCU71_g160, partial [Aureobasidium melanogenum]
LWPTLQAAVSRRRRGPCKEESPIVSCRLALRSGRRGFRTGRWRHFSTGVPMWTCVAHQQLSREKGVNIW